jgi:Flp pilus assembly pilin Flp
MWSNFWRFRQDEDGAVTVDWVVLTAAILIIGVVVGAAVSRGAETMANNTETELTTAVVPDVVF